MALSSSQAGDGLPLLLLPSGGGNGAKRPRRRAAVERMRRMEAAPARWAQLDLAMLLKHRRTASSKVAAQSRHGPWAFLPVPCWALLQFHRAGPFGQHSPVTPPRLRRFRSRLAASSAATTSSSLLSGSAVASPSLQSAPRLSTYRPDDESGGRRQCPEYAEGVVDKICRYTINLLAAQSVRTNKTTN
uniref:Uncharacterized protein n=1 Tax=Oryza glumipatula TaxID=40148 RepID=A0A0E0BEV9_9ORYZ